MICTPDLDHLRATVEILEICAEDTQLLHLQNLCEHYGTWTIPEDHNRFSPALYEISLFGAAGISESADMLAHNWLIAARRVLEVTTPISVVAA